ncbi:MAG: isoprenylcysteine carboxylmethyltransferase family protein [Gemmatimonadota bacterium]|nr:isoprenylcysteine carboxylmethyltransferase family protein [Gemmatimonadota bacterium]
MFVFARAITYAAIFIGLLLIFVPTQILESAGMTGPAAMGAVQIVGMVVGAAGAALALWCVATFAAVGKGTPAPFDPPRRLVVSGPYAFVRNPMYIGAELVLLGVALFYESLPVLGYATVFAFVVYAFIMSYEEPTLRRRFGDEYDRYVSRVPRMWPRRRAADSELNP